MAKTNLPPQPVTDSSSGTKLFFDNYGQTPFEFNATDVDATVMFFESRGFGTDAALVVATVLLKQAKLDGTEIYKILDSIKGFEESQLSQLVCEILNNNRVPTSTLGFKITDVKPNQIRNIVE